MLQTALSLLKQGIVSVLNPTQCQAENECALTTLAHATEEPRAHSVPNCAVSTPGWKGQACLSPEDSRASLRWSVFLGTSYGGAW